MNGDQLFGMIMLWGDNYAYHLLR